MEDLKLSRAIVSAAAIAVSGGAGAMLMAGPAQAATVVAREYENANFGGSDYTLQADESGLVCTASTDDRDEGLPNVGSAWNDRISSFKVFADCLARHWENAGYSGASLGYAGNTGNMGSAMNDRTTSIEYS
ncbi:peptidase inhibitor family I36 protein [Actinoplanes sp. NPDC051411]|uniref:peptidase inhibitor family I36 protein n=1 Tax=Actinoplanes sp. NPDC051411 TaxID=3155522 RepID=UPI00342B6CEA